MFMPSVIGFCVLSSNINGYGLMMLMKKAWNICQRRILEDNLLLHVYYFCTTLIFEFQVEQAVGTN